MAWIGPIKNKKEARKHLVATGKLPDEFQLKAVKYLDISELKALKFRSHFIWPLLCLIAYNLYLVYGSSSV